MSLYSIKADNNVIVIKQISIILFVLGLCSLLGSYLILGYAFDTVDAGFWLPLLFCVIQFLAGIYMTSRPFKFEAQFDPAAQQMSLRFKGIINNNKSVYSYDEIKGFSISISDNDGFWYTPMVELKNEQLEFGFGYGAAESATEFLQRLIPFLNTADKKFELSDLNSQK